MKIDEKICAKYLMRQPQVPARLEDALKVGVKKRHKNKNYNT
jgi:hypothetical protein